MKPNFAGKIHHFRFESVRNYILIKKRNGLQIPDV